MKTLVGDDEPSVVVDDQEGGPSHHVGVGAPLQQRNSRACVLTDKMDETDPKGWKRKSGEDFPEGRKIETQKGNPAMSGISFLKDGKKAAEKEQSGQESLSRRKKQQKTQSAMNLAWLSLWWRRMEREAGKETSVETDRKSGQNLRKFLFIKNKSSSTFPEKSVGERGDGDVLIGRHPSVDEIKEHHPAIISSSGQGLLSRGSKRDSNGGISSPAKRKKTFSNLLSYWENKTDSENPDKSDYKLYTQSEFCRPESSSSGVRGSFSTGDGDEITERDLYMPGGGGG